MSDLLGVDFVLVPEDIRPLCLGKLLAPKRAASW